MSVVYKEHEYRKSRKRPKLRDKRFFFYVAIIIYLGNFHSNMHVHNCKCEFMNEFSDATLWLFIRMVSNEKSK